MRFVWFYSNSKFCSVSTWLSAVIDFSSLPLHFSCYTYQMTAVLHTWFHLVRSNCISESHPMFANLNIFMSVPSCSAKIYRAIPIVNNGILIYGICMQRTVEIVFIAYLCRFSFSSRQITLLSPGTTHWYMHNK